MNRLKKIEMDLQREIGFVINSKMKDPRIGFVTITDTRLSTDFHYLDVFISVMGDDENLDKTIKRLNQNKCQGFIKKHIKENMRLRTLPEIRFIQDTSIEKGMRIHKLLESLKEEKSKQKN